MFFEINKIFLKDEIFNQYKILTKEDPIETQKNRLLKGITKINLFVGANNSGKSRLLRFLFGLCQIPVFHKIKPLKEFNDNEIAELIKEFETDLQDVSLKYKFDEIKEFKQVFSEIEKIKEEFNLNIKIEYFKESLLILNSIINSFNQGGIVPQRQHDKHRIFFSEIQNIWNICTKILKNTDGYIDLQCAARIGQNKMVYKITKIYIPVLRGLRILDSERDELNDFYTNRTASDYFIKEDFQDKTWDLSTNIFTGLTLYQTIMEHLLGNLAQRKVIANYQTFLQEYFFDGNEITLIPSINPRVLNIKIGNEKEQPIHDLGDGLQSLIILTFPLFLYKESHLLLFIEEPELFLHPGMQRVLLEVYNEERFNHVQFFIVTHSNHLLDISIDIDDVSIFTVKKNKEEIDDYEEYLPTFIIENCSNTDRKTLELLGVRNASVFLSNCTIWVEGISDRLYLRHFLDIYQKHQYKENPNENRLFREDIHYSFLEYSGDNIEHFSFLDENDGIQEERLCSKLFLIVDKDEGKEKRHEKLRERLGHNFKRLDRIEIENLIAENILKKIMKVYEKEMMEKIEKIKYEDYANIRMGTYISDLFNNDRYKAESGTLSGYWKTQFRIKTIEYTKSFDDLSNDTEDLCKQLYDFIKSQNQT